MSNRVLLIAGLHSNEVCAPIIADAVFSRLQGSNCQVEVLSVPKEWTLLGNLDDPDGADPQYCIRTDKRLIDMDLEALLGEETLWRDYPGYTAFEFHNFSDTIRTDELGVHRERSPRDFELGNIEPGRTGPYEIGVWQNNPPQGVAGKYCIELPAVYSTLSYNRIATRFHSLELLSQRGYDFDEDRRYSMLEYLIQEADVERSRAKGYLDDVIAEKVARWIVSVMGNG